jgi:hypothetical protein
MSIIVIFTKYFVNNWQDLESLISVDETEWSVRSSENEIKSLFYVSCYNVFYVSCYNVFYVSCYNVFSPAVIPKSVYVQWCFVYNCCKPFIKKI